MSATINFPSTGVTEPSSSPWSSPVTLVLKKNGTTRFCVDYQKLNEVTRKSYPLPRIETFDVFHRDKWFCTQDLKSGYWQVEVSSPDQEKMAFTTGTGLWQFTDTIRTLQCTSNLQTSDGNSSMWIDWQDMPRLFGWCGCLWVDSRRTLSVAQHRVWEAKRSGIKDVTKEMPIVPEGSFLSWVPNFGKRTRCRSSEDECHCYMASTKGYAWG